ncbi:hypothetical protein HYH03_010762 [Edaphochlamys debaryana]|uniref:Uncharacterized protein n=1 Tax=Edaphochlamys debaryana TaxID=47281 RepID=A0A835XW10_9CHLO|nr:hypothetical protein HYH03_010762 [Edaphochlamys debaryana]|eukprot:KAG2490844.1 hypothetical protein HYH03_010762 [Edaphochlamys debaryana]
MPSSSSSTQTAVGPPDKAVQDEYMAWMDVDMFCCTEEEAGLVIEYNDAGLAAHRPDLTPAQSHASIAAIAAEHMEPYVDDDGVPSERFFRGSIVGFVKTQNAWAFVPWMRPKANLPPVASHWLVQGTSEDAEFLEFVAPFKA